MKRFFLSMALFSFVNMLNAQQNFDYQLEEFGSSTEEFFDWQYLNTHSALTRPGQARELTDFIPVQDSIYYSTYNENGGWLTNRITRTLSFDDYGNVTSALEEKLNSGTQEWGNYFDHSTSFYNADQINESVIIPWYINTQVWADTSLYYKYNEEGHRLDYFYKFYQNDQNSFNEGYRFTTTSFTPEGESLTEDHDTWNGGLQVWEKSRKTNNTYENGLFTERLFTIWNTVTSSWENFERQTYNNDENGYRIEDIRERFNLDTHEWENYQKYILTNNTEGILVEYTVFAWDNLIEAWVNRISIVYTFDDNGNRIETLRQDWEEDFWLNRRKNSYTYDENQNRTERKRESWNADISDWENDWKYEYFWSLHDITKINELDPNQFNISPNPSSDKLFLECFSCSLSGVSVDIYSASGHLVLKNAVLNDGKIDIHMLPSGIYFLNIFTNEGRVVKKISKI